MKDWSTVTRAALALPDAVLGTAYGKPAVKVRNKVLVAMTAPDPRSFVLHVTAEDKEVLIATDPGTFWETDHYRGWPAVLVRFGTPATERIAMLIARAWWDRATQKQRTAYGERP